MTTQTKIKRLQSLWWDWLAASEKLLRALHEQTAALTLRDPARMERLQPDIDALIAQMRQSDEQAVASARTLAEELGVEPSLRGVVDALERADAQNLQALANRVIVAGRHIQQVMGKNRSLIENELDFVGGTLALFAREASIPSHPYRPTLATAAVVMNEVA